MTSRLISIITLLFVAFLSIPSSAQHHVPHFETHAVTPATPLYRDLIHQATHSPYGENFPFYQLRNAYAATAQFKPQNDHVEDTLHKILFHIEHSEDNPVELDQHMGDYRTLRDQHLGHIGVVELAMETARKDDRLGDPKFYEWLYAGLARSILYTGSGEDLRNAYQVISFNEEDFILRFKEFEKVRTDIVMAGEGKYLYHRHLVKKSGKRKTNEIYVDASFPLGLLERLEDLRTPHTIN